jgi:3-deoxy-D-manno-octulosonic-acid transferase
VNTVRGLYSLLIRLLAPFIFVTVLWRGLRDRSYWVGLGERFGFGARAPAPTLWLHAVSLGEVTAAASLVRALRARYPEIPLVVTTATPTGRARARALFGDGVDIRFLPYDTPGSMRRFLGRIRPRLALIMETELWPNLYRECRRRGIPLLLASARLSARSVSRYRRFGGLFRELFSEHTFVAAQSADDADRFIAIGAAAARTRVVGNLKFDVELGHDAAARGLELRARYWEGRPTWIAGSTHAGEEELVLTAHAALQADVPGALLLLVPRHPVRFQGVADLLARRGVRFERRSSDNPVRSDCEVLLVDRVGELVDLYAAADVAFVGGSLVPIGGHNLLEPAALGLPVITGPYQANNQDVAQLLLRQGAAVQAGDEEELAAQLSGLFGDPAKRRLMGTRGARAVAANRGALMQLLELIDPLLAGRPPDVPPPAAPQAAATIP